MLSAIGAALQSGMVFLFLLPQHILISIWAAVVFIFLLPGRLWMALFGKRFRRNERDFLPAALEILETPANPLGQLFGIVIMVMFTSAIVWAFLGEIDVVATGQGQLVPIGGRQGDQAAASGRGPGNSGARRSACQCR